MHSNLRVYSRFYFRICREFLNGLLLLHYARELKKKWRAIGHHWSPSSRDKAREGRRHILKKRIFSVPPCIRKSFVISKIMLASRKTNRRKLSASKNLALCSLISFSIYTALPLLNPFFPTLPPSTLPTVLLHCLGRF